MATSLDCLASLSINATLSATTSTIGTAVATLNKTFGAHFTQGTGAGLCDLVWWTESTVVASGSDAWDLAGVLTDPYGTVITFARIKAIVVYASPSNTNNVVVGGAASNAFAGIFGSTTHTAVVRPGAFVAWGCGSADAIGYVVTAATADQLKVANSAGTTPVVYDIAIMGNSA